MGALTKAAAFLFGKALVGGAKVAASKKPKPKKPKKKGNKKGSLAEQINFGGKNKK